MKFFSILTAALLAAAGIYFVAWFAGFITGDFPLLLMIATFITGLYWIAEKLYFRKQRQRTAQALTDQLQSRRLELLNQGISDLDENNINQVSKKASRQPWWLEWSAGLFPVIALVFLLRSFAYEPFRIPSGSMIPTLLVGDLILVDKFVYGLRIPVWHSKLTEGRKPKRGEVIVFRFPPDPKVDYIKRVVGLPGDVVSYQNKKLTINGKEIKTTAMPDFFNSDAKAWVKQWREELGEHPHDIIKLEYDIDMRSNAINFPNKQMCQYSFNELTCQVPQGHYFVMGDNRDNSQDSRSWGFVPEDHIVGRAVAIWMSFSQSNRIGKID